MYHRNKLIAIYNQISNNHFDKIKKREIMKKGSSTATIIIVVAIIIIAISAGIYFATKKTSSANNSNSKQENSNGDVKGATSGTREIVSTPNADIMIFYGDTCPHCKKVNDYIVANNIDNIVKLQHLEVYENKANLELMKQKLDLCKNLSADDKGGVPFMYSSETCLVGDQPIIDFLKAKAS